MATARSDVRPAELVKYADKPAFVVFNATPARGVQLFADASVLVSNLGLNVCLVTFADRPAFHHSTTAGKVAAEVDPNGKAATKANALWLWACEQVGKPARKRVSTRTRSRA